MPKFFNTTGPCYPEKHYMLPAQARCTGLYKLIEQEHYFVIHAARQSGKTTLLLDLARELNDSGKYYALYCSLESVQDVTDPEKGLPMIVDCLQMAVEFHPHLSSWPFAENADNSRYSTLLIRTLSNFCKELDKPLVILFDEVDCLANGTLVMFLRQLRNGYVNRGHIPFVHSVALVGMRNIRDYKASVRDNQETLGSASPFNITKISTTLRNFTATEIGELYAQYSEATGQIFPPEVIQKVWQYTQGQPWLVNAIAAEITEQLADVGNAILPEYVEQATQALILRRDTHIDSLLARLKESRVQRVMEPLITGQSKGYEWGDDDYQYTWDLGLVRESEGKLIAANPIYGEVILRTLSSSSYMELTRKGFPPEAPAYLNDGKLDMHHLLADFQAFWRVNSESWIQRYQYKEAAPHLILHAFLYRIVNGGGRITREMASGNGRLDLCLHYLDEKYPVEVKLRYSDQTYAEGLSQLAGYMDQQGCSEGWLVVFDRRVSVSWEEKIFWETHEIEGKRIHVVGA